MVISFKEYIESKYLDKIFYEVKDYILENRTNIDFKCKKINEPQQVWLEDAYFKKFYVHDYNNDIIGMNIIVETQLTLKEYTNGEVYDETVYPWFLVKCSCKLSDTITNFKVIFIESYVNLHHEEYGLTDNLIPYIRKNQFDNIALEILKKYYPKALQGSKVDPFEFATALGLNLKEVKFKNKNQLGRIFFEDSKVKKSNGEIRVIKANTIEYSKDTDLFKFSNSLNFTIMHECCHYILHKKAFQLERLFNKNAKSISCMNDGTGKTEAKSSPIDWMEWQANRLASRLLMPKKQFINKVESLLSYYRLTFKTNDLLDYYEKIMYDLKFYYDVPVESVKIRLVELGYEFPLGCFIQVDGKNVLSHSFSKGSLNENETFSISEIDAAMFCFNQRHLNKNDLINGYIYVDSHLCINHPKYITNINGILHLTEYARCHMDECCIKFCVDVRKKIGHNDINYKTLKILNRKKGNNAELVVKGYFEISQYGHNNNLTLLKEANDKIDKLYFSLPRTTDGLFNILRKYSGYSIDELIDLTGFSKNTIDSYMYSDKQNFNLKIVVKLLLAMNIPLKVSMCVLDICNCKFKPSNNDHQWMEYVLCNRWVYSIEDNIKFLQNVNIYL